MMASEERPVEQKESEEKSEQAASVQTATLEVDLQAHGSVEKGVEEQGKKEKETEKEEEEEVKEKGEEGGAQATMAEQPSIPQPPYDEDFNPFSDEVHSSARDCSCDGSSHYNLKNLLHCEESSDPNEGWKFISRTEFTEVWRKSDPTKPVHLVKGFLQFPGVPPNEVADVISDIESRKKWDKRFPIMDVLEEHKNFKVVYWLTKMPVGVANRDIVQFLRRQYDAETNTTYILYRNASHPKAPLQRGVVRAETILSATIIRPDPEDPASTRVTILLQNDAKGWIPHFIINAFTARAPKQWRDNLYCYMRGGPTDTEESEEKEEGEGEEKGTEDKGTEGAGVEEETVKEVENEGNKEEEDMSPQETKETSAQ